MKKRCLVKELRFNRETLEMEYVALVETATEGEAQHLVMKGGFYGRGPAMISYRTPMREYEFIA